MKISEQHEWFSFNNDKVTSHRATRVEEMNTWRDGSSLFRRLQKTGRDGADVTQRGKACQERAIRKSHRRWLTVVYSGQAMMTSTLIVGEIWSWRQRAGAVTRTNKGRSIKLSAREPSYHTGDTVVPVCLDIIVYGQNPGQQIVSPMSICVFGTTLQQYMNPMNLT